MMTATLHGTAPERPVTQQGEAISLYAHVPFCRTRCSYCAFNTVAGQEELLDPFVAALCREIGVVGVDRPMSIGRAHTLYFGGGTPSLLEPLQVEAVVASSRAQFGLAQDAEITLETNPGTADLVKMRGFRAAGINRLSIGVQSAHESELALFGRHHSFEDAATAFRLARAAGFDDVSVDLIYGAPLQTREGWRETLGAVLAWEPDHLSLYSLTLETQTLLERQVRNGRVPAPDPDLAADMYDDAREHAARAGLIHYEISNWARAGRESRHNRQYWLDRPFLGFGPGAYGTVAGVRYWNVRPVREYIRRMSAGKTPEFPFSPAMEDFETINRKMAMAETMILGLRLVQEGVDRAAFARRFGTDLENVYGAQIASLKRLGLLDDRGGRLRLTEQAYLVSNRVFVCFMPETA